jgi:uncharacterized protein (TIGR02217 family)
MTGFHEVLFPLGLSRGAKVSLEHRVKIIGLNNGHERRISPWAHGRRRYEVIRGVESASDLADLMAFFQARKGPLFGFRFRDPFHDRSCSLSDEPSPFDQVIALGNGISREFQLIKTQGEWQRPITKPAAGSLKLSVGDQEITQGFSLNQTTGLVTFSQAPPDGALIKAGFLFDTPVRFDTEVLEISLEAFSAGQLQPLRLIEIL